MSSPARSASTPTHDAPLLPAGTAGPDATPPVSAEPLRVLLVEDNEGDAELMRLLLEDAADETLLAGAPRVRWVERVSAACAALEAEPVDVVLLDLSLPDARGLETVTRVRAAAPTALPIVVLTGLDDEHLALLAMQAGAQDYLVKGTVTASSLRRALRHAVERQRLVDAAQRATTARDVVLGVVAHDLRNPISTIKMCAGALAEQPPAPQESVEYLAGVVLRSAEWMEHIIRDLLDVTAIEAGRLAVDVVPVGVAAVVEGLRALFAPLAAEKGITFGVRTATELPRIQGDVDRLIQAIGNLLGNALKFTPQGGAVTVAAERRGEAHVRFEVRDTGPGIPVEHQPHVFDRFWQARETRRAGAGLGLAIAKGIAEAHGGTIGVVSAPGEGTTFWVEVPVAP